MAGEKNKISKRDNPLLTATVLNKIFFWWMTDIIINGSKHELEEKDIYNILTEDQSVTLKTKLQVAWSQECTSAFKKNEKPSLKKCLIKVFKWKFIFWSTVCFGYSIIQTIQPLVLEQIVLYFQSSEMSTVKACLFVSLSILLLITVTVMVRTSFFELTRLALNIRISCSSLIYNKLLRLSSSSNERNTSISVINLLSTDVSKFEALMCYLPFLFTIPMQTITATYFICTYLNITTAIIGCISLILQSLPGQVIYFKFITKLRAKQASETDKRISLISEVINGIRAVKMYVWENYFVNLVQTARRREIDVFLKMSYFKSFMAACLHSAQRSCIFLVVLTNTLQNQSMSITTLIPIAQYLSVMKESVVGIFNLTIRCLADANTSIKRIESFLKCEEFVSLIKTKSNESSKKITIKNVSASWNSKISDVMLRDIDIEFQEKQLYVILGSVGAGKTSLLKIILGEMPLISGDIWINGKISYASQEPWLFNGSIKDNIIFGETYNVDRYNGVVGACALLEDFNHLPFGDETLVGEKGASLSGGQCARVSLARAVYKNADIYLLDDPLSAVDTRVANVLLENCIHDLLKNKMRILVTHKVQALAKAERIILLNKGLIQYQGTFAKFQSSEHYSTDFSSIEKKSHYVETTCLTVNSSDVVLYTPGNENEESEPQETEELLAKGGISKFVFLKYVQFSESYISFAILIFSSIAVTSACVGFDYWMVTWVQNQKCDSQNASRNHSTSSIPEIEQKYAYQAFLYISTSLLISIVLFSVIKNLFFHKFALAASKNVHNSMFVRLVSAPLKFFHTNPSGRILNRFSEDTISVDDFYTQTMLDSLDACIFISALFILVLIINPWHIILLLIYSYLSFKLYKLCTPTIRNTRILAGAAVSPILSHANSSFLGLTTIRSQKAEIFVNDHFDSCLDRFTAAHLLHIGSAAAMRTWIDLLVPILFGFVVYTSVLMKNSDNVAGYMGLSIMQILNLSTMFSYLVKILSETITYTVNLERMFEFTKLEQECLNQENIKLPPNWPAIGEIKFDHLYLRYSENDAPVLQNIDITILPGMKVGIVGRTGAGKSSLISALFRTVGFDGTIFIDGVDTKKVSLPHLRSKISIIPQEPVIFNASLRSNLDPFNEFEDATLWSALHSVELKQTFSSLEYLIEKGGQNLSLGQRQLLCLARAIVKNNKILVLDEATANIDHITDTLIQKTIKERFINCTVITIAHRLNTVIDSDRVIVMNNGRVVEYDHPNILLQKKEGYFLDMIQQSGANSSQHLKDIAEQADRNVK